MTSPTAPSPDNPSLVIRKLDDKITIFSVPFTRGGRVPFGGRSTAISLASTNTTVIFPSHPLCPATLATLQTLPPVSHLISPDLEHHLFVADYATAFPDAKLYLPKPIADKGGFKDRSVFVFGEIGGTGGELEKETGGELACVDFGKAFANQDIAFLHKPTKTLIEADLLFNLPPNEQYSKTTAKKTVFFLSSHMRPGTYFHKFMLWHALGKQRAGMIECSKKVAAWDFDRIIPCHGDVIETGGKQAWLKTYEWFLKH